MKKSAVLAASGLLAVAAFGGCASQAADEVSDSTPSSEEQAQAEAPSEEQAPAANPVDELEAQLIEDLGDVNRDDKGRP